VIDFGISRAVEASALTHTGLVVGSPGFMSPEQAEGREVGPPSDIFSLGAVLAFAASGQGRAVAYPGTGWLPEALTQAFSLGAAVFAANWP
jgi:serine/threonine protein kinase